jgi:hypothetical protein
MEKLRFTILGIVLAMLLGSSLVQPSFAQQGTKHLLSDDELKKAIPVEYFYRGQKATVQVRNSGGAQLADGRMVLVSLVDASGYSTAIQQKYQGMLITEAKLSIGGSELAPGQYGFGFTAEGKFVVMNVANEDALSVAFQTDNVLKRPVPLKLVEDGSGYKLYGGRKWVEIKVE